MTALGAMAEAGAATHEEHPNLTRDNRRKGDLVEEVAVHEILSRVHDEVLIVGRDHHDFVEKYRCGAPFDAVGDGIRYEIKGCDERVRNRHSQRRATTRPGRFKVDAYHHFGMEPEIAATSMYLFVVMRDGKAVRGYTASWAKVTRFLKRYMKRDLTEGPDGSIRGRNVSLSHAVITRELLCVWRAPGERRLARREQNQARGTRAGVRAC